ncbi:MAG: flavodoxin [Lachnoclostridium sp.]|nr:flavodoxin [Lachnoclostridium sp.]
MNRIVTAILCVLGLTFTACASKTGEKATTETNENKTLIAYFSAQGHTKAAAEKVAAATGGDLFEIRPEQPYTEEDLDGWNDSARGTRESKDRTTRPGISNKVENFEQYDTIYLGFPIWWYTAPTIINTFLESYNTDGKVIIPFATSGGSEYGYTEKDLRVSAPKATFKPGKLLNDMDEIQIKGWTEEVIK